MDGRGNSVTLEEFLCLGAAGISETNGGKEWLLQWLLFLRHVRFLRVSAAVSAIE